MKAIKNFFRNLGAKIRKVFSPFIAEVKKVSWPTGKQVLNNTVVVLVVCILCGVILFGVDSIFGFMDTLLFGN